MAAHRVSVWQTSGFGLVARHSSGEGDDDDDDDDDDDYDDDDDDDDDDDVLLCQQQRAKQRWCVGAFVRIPTRMTTAQERLQSSPTTLQGAPSGTV